MAEFSYECSACNQIGHITFVRSFGATTDCPEDRDRETCPLKQLTGAACAMVRLPGGRHAGEEMLERLALRPEEELTQLRGEVVRLGSELEKLRKISEARITPGAKQ